MNKTIDEIFKEDPRREAQYCSLLAWYGKTPEEATEIIKQSYEDVDKQVYTNDSVNTAIAKIQEKSSELIGKNKFKAIIEIIVSIHDKWVETNAKKYDRGDVAKSKKQIFQHLPTALIGIDEVAKDLMFLAPFLKYQYGINVGSMQNQPWGAFIPSSEFIEAYNEYVEDFKIQNNLNSDENLLKYLSNVTNEYKALQGNDEVSEKRRIYMQQYENVEVMLNSVKAKNSTFDYGLEV